MGHVNPVPKVNGTPEEARLQQAHVIEMGTHQIMIKEYLEKTMESLIAAAKEKPEVSTEDWCMIVMQKDADFAKRVFPERDGWHRYTWMAMPRQDVVAALRTFKDTDDYADIIDTLNQPADEKNVYYLTCRPLSNSVIQVKVLP